MTIVRECHSRHVASRSMTVVFIYALVDADGVHYIGQSVDPVRRLKQHMGCAERGASRNRHLEIWLRSLDGVWPELRLLGQSDDRDQADAIERWCIAEARRLDEPLTNINAGGDRFLRQRQYTRTEVCSVEGCERTEIAQRDPALCFTCRKRIRENDGVDPGFRAAKATECKIDGCENEHGGKIVHDLCPKHLARLQRNGDPHIVKHAYPQRRLIRNGK